MSGKKPPALSLSMSLISQGQTTIVVGGIPVLSFTNESNPEAKIVNFLRSGCPFVQCKPVDDKRENNSDKEMLETNLKALELSGETFSIQMNESGPVILTVYRHYVE